MEFQLFKFLHVITIIYAIVLAEGTIVHAWLAARRRDVPGLRHALREGERGDRWSNPLLLVSIVFGVLAALAGEIDLTAPWLIAAYGVIVFAFGFIGLSGGFRHLQLLQQAAEASPDEEASAELVALIGHPRTYLVTFLPPVLMVALVYLMVVKPALW